MDQRFAMITVDASTGNETARHYYHTNRLGSVIAMSDTTGTVTDKYVYTPYGVESPLTGSGNPFRYTGRRFDVQTGLYFYRARYYSAELGRFLETDPVGYEDQMNLYNYVSNDPLNLTDPTGLARFDRFDTIDEAAVDLLLTAARETIEQDVGAMRERGGDILQDPKTDKYYYDSIEIGTNDKIPLFINKNSVAIAHTHPPDKGGSGTEDSRSDRSSNGKLSREDKDQVKQTNRYTGRKVPTYVASTDGTVTKFTKEEKNYRRGSRIREKGTVKFSKPKEEKK